MGMLWRVVTLLLIAWLSLMGSVWADCPFGYVCGNEPTGATTCPKNAACTYGRAPLQTSESFFTVTCRNGIYQPGQPGYIVDAGYWLNYCLLHNGCAGNTTVQCSYSGWNPAATFAANPNEGYRPAGLLPPDACTGVSLQ